MDIDLISNQIVAAFYGFIKSPFFLTLKFLLAIYVTVLFADIVMLLILRGFGDVRTTFKGANIPLMSAKKTRKKWNKIESRLESGNYSEYKLAIIEADKIVDKIFSSMNLKGKDMVERIENLKPDQLEGDEELKETHKIRNKIINDPSFNVEKGEVKRILDVYAKFLIDNEFME